MTPAPQPRARQANGPSQYLKFLEERKLKNNDATSDSTPRAYHASNEWSWQISHTFWKHENSTRRWHLHLGQHASCKCSQPIPHSFLNNETPKLTSTPHPSIQTQTPTIPFQKSSISQLQHALTSHPTITTKKLISNSKVKETISPSAHPLAP